MGSDKPISENLKEYKTSLEEEFELAARGDSDQIADAARKKLFHLLNAAVEAHAGILSNGDKDDSVRLGAIKLVYEYTMGKPVPLKPEESDIDKLIKSLQKPNLKEPAKTE